MSICGKLSDFSLPEILRFMEQGNKTGLLSVFPFPKSESKEDKNYFIWFRQGLIVGAANSLDEKNLTSLIISKGWIKEEKTLDIAEKTSKNTPLGLTLKSMGFLTAEQLKQLFYLQVTQRINNLFNSPNGMFRFDTSATLPNLEMTGLNMSAAEANIIGLHNLSDLSKFSDYFPEAHLGLVSLIEDKPKLPLDRLEWRIWEFSNGRVSLTEIASVLNLSIERVQQLAFCLTAVGLVEEVPVAEVSAPKCDILFLDSPPENQVSQSFLQNLFGFLRGKSTAS